MSEYYAHIRRNKDGTIEKQTVEEHCRHSAEIASELLEPIGIGKAAYIAGYLHDMGKCKREFQEYLENSFNGLKVTKGSVVHTFTGVKYVLDKYHNNDSDVTKIVAEIIAYAIGAHHGLFDINAFGKENGFSHRLNDSNNGYEESKEGFLRSCMNSDKIDAFMKVAEDELWNIISNKLLNLYNKENEDEADSEIAFNMGLLERLLLSSVLEGDRSDTASFMSGELYHEKKDIVWDKYLTDMERKLEQFPNKREIDQARKEISDSCRAFANHRGGVFTLNVPTGGGKTLASLRYALAHAAKYHKQHIIFTIPLLSILEQNAAVIRQWIKDDSIILEHHSNVITDEMNGENDGEREALIESWDSPIIITTLVQLLNTMFSGKSSSIRRFHSLVDSIIVIDEVQTVPLKLLSLFNLAVSFLAEVCNTTVVLCSATQPELADTEHPLLTAPVEMVPYDKRIWEVFKRTDITDGGSMTLEEVQDFAVKLIGSARSLLIVCNKKVEAEQVYNGILGKGYNCYHLSASMCMEHRRRTLKEIGDDLLNASTDNPVICVATQVIEAGVDLSFETVIRLAAGMDSVIQTAGRCNRNAENKKASKVYIIRLQGENLSKLQDIKRGKDATISLLNEYAKNPEKFSNDLSSQTAIKEYYRTFYNQYEVGSMNFPIKEKGCTIFDLLSLNTKYCLNDYNYYYRQAFKTAGAYFSVFEEDNIDAIVPYGEGKEIITQLCSVSRDDFVEMKQLIKQAAQYSVSVYRYQQKELEKTGGLYWICDGSVAVLADENYDSKTGFTMKSQQMEYLEV